MPKPLIPVRLPVPGSWGLNTQRRADLLPSLWATIATNFIFDDSGRLASRRGTQDVTATLAGTPGAIFEYIDKTGAKLKIYAEGTKIYKLVGTTSTDITGTVTATDDRWQFQNFNGKCIGFQSGHAPIVMTAVTGSFAPITLSGTQQPTTAAHTVLAAYGRLWCLDQNNLKYSDALDETSWNGLFDMSTVWLGGMDIPTGLADFNGFLVVFGKNSISVYKNPWSPSSGSGYGDIDVSVMELVENIGGIGCVGRDTIQNIGDDIIFLSNQGIRSLGRTIQEKSMPLRAVSQNVNDELLRYLFGENPADIVSTYYKQEGAYIISFPVNEVTYYIDMRRPLQDGSFRVTKWDKVFSCMFTDDNNALYLGWDGHLAKYYGYLDDVAVDGTGGTSYPLEYVSGWTDLSEVDQQLATLTKIPKNGDFLCLGGSGQTLIIKWAFDFIDSFTTFTKELPATSNAEWGPGYVEGDNVNLDLTDPTDLATAIALGRTWSEWGPQYVTGSEDPETLDNDEWSGGLIFNKVKAPLRRTGQVMKFGIALQVQGEAVALQLLDMLLKTGRINS